MAGFKDTKNQSHEYWKECKRLHATCVSACVLKNCGQSESINKSNQTKGMNNNRNDVESMDVVAPATATTNQANAMAGVAHALPTVTQQDDDISLSGHNSEVEEPVYWDNREKALKYLRHCRKLWMITIGASTLSSTKTYVRQWRF